MFNIVLYQPEIPPNTGNIIRLCANTGSKLHLIHPLGFSLTEKQFLRAGLDYHDLTSLTEYDNYTDFLAKCKPQRIFAVETCGARSYSDVSFRSGDYLLFGRETNGIAEDVLATVPKENILRIPMMENNRSINLSNSVAIVVYEAWRQLDWK